MNLLHAFTGDTDHYVRTLKVTPQRAVRPRDPQEFSDGGEYVRFTRLPARLTARDRAQVLQAIADTMTTHGGCGHSYDCCGCASYRTRVRYLGGRRVAIFTRCTLNY